MRSPLTETQLNKLYSKEVQTGITQAKQQNEDNTTPWVKNDQGKWIAATAITKEMNQTANSAQLAKPQQTAPQPFKTSETESTVAPSSTNSNAQPPTDDVQITEKTKTSATLSSTPLTPDKPVTITSGITTASSSMIKTINVQKSSETTSTNPTTTTKKLSSFRLAKVITTIKNTFLKPLTNWFIRLKY